MSTAGTQSECEGGRRMRACDRAARGVVLCAIVAAVGAAMPALAQEAAPVTDTLKQAGETAGATIDKFADVVKGDPWRYGHFIAAGVALIVAFAADLARPGSLQRAGVRKLTEHASLTWFLCAVLVLGAQIVGSGFAGYLPASWRGLDASGAGAGSLQFQAVTQGASYVAALVTAFVLVRILHSSSKGAGLGFTARGFAWGMLGFLMAWPIVMSASIGFVALHEKMQGVKIASELGHPTLKLLTENQSSPYAWMLGLCAIVAAPLVEEIIYRGFVQSSVHRLTNSPWIAIFVSSVLFAGVHAIPNKDAAGDWVFLIPWYSAATVGVLGLCCGIAYERTKEIGVPIAMHILFNMSNVVLALVLTK